MYIYLKKYNKKELVEFYKNKIDKKYLFFLENAIDYLQKKDYKINDKNMMVFDIDGINSYFSNINDGIAEANYYKKNNINFLEYLIGDVNNLCYKQLHGYNL